MDGTQAWTPWENHNLHGNCMKIYHENTLTNGCPISRTPSMISILCHTCIDVFWQIVVCGWQCEMPGECSSEWCYLGLLYPCFVSICLLVLLVLYYCNVGVIIQTGLCTSPIRRNIVLYHCNVGVIIQTGLCTSPIRRNIVLYHCNVGVIIQTGLCTSPIRCNIVLYHCNVGVIIQTGLCT